MSKSIEKNEIAISIVKSTFATIPYVGQLLTEAIFEYRGRIKQNRLNKFTEMLSDYFSHNVDFEPENLKSEDFSDLLESILRRVVETKSEEKLKRFKDILVSSMNQKIDYENSERYLDLVKGLSEIEIKILKNHFLFDSKFDKRLDYQLDTEHSLIDLNENVQKELELIEKGYANNLDIEQAKLKAAQNSIRVIDEQNKAVNLYRTHEFYEIEESEFLYHKQKLFSLGLLIDFGAGRKDFKPFRTMSITEFAKKFIEFIKQ